MNEVKEFIILFFKKEAEAYDKWLKPDIKVFNSTLKQMHSMVVGAMNGQMGMVELQNPESEDFYEDYADEDPTTPRHLFKISHYKHSVHNEAWVIYTSEVNPRMRFPVLSIAFFVIKEEGKFKVARNYIYSNQGGMSTEYGWEGSSGIQDLTFESLGELIAIERYLEPKDRRDALKLYNEDA